MYRVNYHSRTRTKSKYRNQSKVYTSTLHGTRTFDSVKEANYCEQLDWRLKAGEVRDYLLQVRIELKGLQGKRVANYYCDFKVQLADGTWEYHEVKGMELPLWQLKWALTQQQIAIDEPEVNLIVIK